MRVQGKYCYPSNYHSPIYKKLFSNPIEWKKANTMGEYTIQAKAAKQATAQLIEVP